MGSIKTVVVIPTLDEAAHIGSVTAQFMADSAVDQIWILDGGSTDGTLDLARDLAHSPRVRLIENPGRTQAAALNLAADLAARAQAEILIRADAHAHYPDLFATGLIRALTQTGADSVTVPLIAAPAAPTPWQAAGADLQRSWLGHGGALHRQASPSGWVDHGHHAAFRLTRFLALGGYDTAFQANEDVEFDLRLTRAGGRIWFAAHLPVAYEPRPGPRATFRQMFRNGRGRAQTAEKHKIPLGARQLLPVAVVLLLALMLEALLFMPPDLAKILASPGLAYLTVLAAGAVHLGRGRVLHMLRIATLAWLSHTGFGLGVLWQSLIRPRAQARPLPQPARVR